MTRPDHHGRTSRPGRCRGAHGGRGRSLVGRARPRRRGLAHRPAPGARHEPGSGGGFRPRRRRPPLLALIAEPKGPPATALDTGQREILRGPLAAYRGRVPAGLAPPLDEDAVHFAWAGPTEPGAPHYYRLQAPRLLLEWDDTARGADHAHSVWRDPETDFGLDALSAHRAALHG